MQLERTFTIAIMGDVKDNLGMPRILHVRKADYKLL